jgi:hypothetical protein
MHARVILAACAASLTFGLGAHAGQLEDPRTDYTAYTRPRGRVAAGPLKLEMGIIDEIMVGTYVPPWFAFPWLKVPVPNGYLKLRSFWGGPFTLAVRGGVTYIDGKAVAQLADKQASASAMSYVADIDASYRIDPRFSVSLGLDWARLQAVGDTKDQATSVEGASAAHTYSLRAFGEWRLTRVFAITLLLRGLLYQSPISAQTTTEDPAFTVDGNLTAESAVQKRFTAVPGVSFVWDRWELSAGAGYGVFYLPVLGLASAKAWPVVDLSAAFRFDLYH